MHSMVSTASLSIRTPAGSLIKEEVVWQPRELDRTQASDIGSGLIKNFETSVGRPLEEWLGHALSTYGSVNFVATGDSASANVKLIVQLFNFFRQFAAARVDAGSGIITGVFTPCFLHQAARLLALHLDHAKLTPCLFSITRLQQHAASRNACKKAMQVLLKQKFKFYRGQDPPICFMTSSLGRNGLYQLLTGVWTGEADDTESLTHRKKTLQKCLKFFNGNLLSGEWAHYCPNDQCHHNERDALNEVFGL